MFDRAVFYDSIRPKFGGLSQSQVDGMGVFLNVWEKYRAGYDLRWLAYCMATTRHETASTMQPIEEYGKGSGMAYGVPDSRTGQTYYGRGFVQLTWLENYQRADKEIAAQFPGITTNMEWHAEQALDMRVAAAVCFLGHEQGWFRVKDGKPETLERHFSDTVDDPVGARNIINGDQNKVPSWSNGVTIGNLIAGYHRDFLVALDLAWSPEPVAIAPEVGDEETITIQITITTPRNVIIEVEQAFRD
jgi:predicted chitinase